MGKSTGPEESRMPKSSKFKAAFHANLQGFIFNVKFQKAQHGFFRIARAHSFSVAFSAKLHGLYVNANLATSNLVGQTKSRFSKLRRLGYSMRFRVRHIGLKCRGLHVRCKSALRRWPSSAKSKPSSTSGAGSKAPEARQSVDRSNLPTSPPPCSSTQSLFHNPEKLVQNLEEIFQSPQKLLQMVVEVFRILHRKLPLSWLRDVGKLYLSEGQVTGLVGSLPLVSHLASKQRGAAVVQALCLVATLVVLFKVAIAATMPKLGLSIWTSPISLGLFLDYLGLLATGIWRLWAERHGSTLLSRVLSVGT